MKRSNLRRVSPKRVREAPKRRRLVAALLEERPVCQRCHQARSTDAHEPLLRSRGGNILDPDQCKALCHRCHMHIHQNVAEATEQGWLIHSWEAK